MSGSSNPDHRAAFLAGGTLVGFIVALALTSFGAPRWQAAGVGLMVLGIALWIGSIRPDPSTLDLDERQRRQRHRSLAIALALGALVAIFYVATLVRLGPNALNKKDGFAEVGSAKKNVIIEDKSQCRKAGTC